MLVLVPPSRPVYYFLRLIGISCIVLLLYKQALTAHWKHNSSVGLVELGLEVPFSWIVTNLNPSRPKRL
jgi:hypothetical protein